MRTASTDAKWRSKMCNNEKANDKKMNESLQAFDQFKKR
jgi:hypothetical protein